MPHGDAIIDGDGIEFLRHATCPLDFTGYQLPHVLKVDMPRDELGEGIGDGNDGFLKVRIGHARGAPQGASASHVTTFGCGAGAITGHGGLRQVSGCRQLAGR